MRTKSHRKIQSFITTSNTKAVNINTCYNDEEFCRDIQVLALEDIHFLISRINNKTNPFVLANYINKPHPETKITALDYCVLAGLDEIAEQLISMGAKSTNIDRYSEMFVNNDNEDANNPEIINNIQETIRLIKMDQQQSASSSESLPLTASSWLQFKKICKQHRVPAFFLGLGAILSLASPAAPATAGTAILLSVGIPSILGGLKLLQSSYVSQTDAALLAEIKRTENEKLEIKALVKSVDQLKHQMKQNVKPTAAVKQLADKYSVTKPILRHDSEQILFEYPSHFDNHEDQLSNISAAIRLKLSLTND
jgi:uncharacterized membrane protein